MSLIEAVRANDVVQVSKLLASSKLSRRSYIELLGEAAEAGYLEIVQILINVGRNFKLESLETLFGSALQEAAYSGHLEVVKALLAVGAQVNLSRKYKDTPTALILAAQEGYFKIVKVLVEAGANVNEVCERGSAIWMAAANGDEKTFNYLAPLSDPGLRQQAEEQLPHGIRQRQRKEVADPRSNALASAIHYNNINKVREILASGLDVNAFDEYGLTPLQNAVVGGEASIIQLLLEVGANPNLGDDEMAETPLIGAICRSKKSHHLTCSLLIAAGADVNAQTNDGMTALMWAARFGFLETVLILLESGADVSIKDNEGKNTLDYAIQYSQQDWSWTENTKYDEVIENLQEARDKEDQ